MKKINYCLSFTVLLCTMALVQCQKSSKTDPPVFMPVVTTDSVTNITPDGVSVYSKTTSDGGNAITSKGVCWNTSSNPTISNSKTTDGSGTSSYKTTITGLNNNTTYYLKPYATNKVGTAYGTEISFTTDKLQTISSWMLNNLSVTTYRNGDSIPQVTDITAWSNLTTGAWCYYNNDTANGTKYGKLYNWYAVNDPRGLAPTGWHIPTKDEWTNWVNFLGGDAIAGGKLKTTTLWLTPNTGATNESGFNGKPGGYRTEAGIFGPLISNAFWWTLKEHDATTAVERSLSYDIANCYMYYYDKRNGMSVRCIKN